MRTCSEPGRRCCGKRRRGITRCSLHVSWQGNHRSDAAAAIGESSSPAERQRKAPRRRFLRQEEDQQPYQGAQPGKQAENGAEPPHAPSAPAVVERAEPPDWPADVSLPPPSAAEPSNPWRFPAYRLRGPCLAETFCQVRCNGGPRNADEQAAW
ncbi:hypothetical protein ATANTOWER_028839 [Ataeniobius toweri]|uniref:Uncharacterized protein n=1 Tax=Ataeniobius toweri TaxID=208326 RepID=A0ABU7CCV3_9TELE|nr:hypothetical protein [Ataeniobius toweri]